MMKVAELPSPAIHMISVKNDKKFVPMTIERVVITNLNGKKENLTFHRIEDQQVNGGFLPEKQTLNDSDIREKRSPEGSEQWNPVPTLDTFEKNPVRSSVNLVNRVSWLRDRRGTAWLLLLGDPVHRVQSLM
jgi:hypothetical protein